MAILQALSLSHQTANLQWRQALQLSKAEAAGFMQALREQGLADGILVIATCNRTEVYFENENLNTAQVADALLSYKHIEDTDSYKQLFREYTTTEDTLRYLLEVGLGLRSQVIGDRQIIGQFKDSYQHAKELGFAGPLLHKALQTLFRTHKRVHNETDFRVGASSVGYAALERVTDFIPRHEFARKRLLVIGTGQMGTDVARHAASFGFTDITLTNRTGAKARQLAHKLQAHYLPYSQHLAQLPQYDVVISCVGGGAPLTPAQLGRPCNTVTRVVLDLSVPQSVAPAVAGLPATVLINMDQIMRQTQEVQQRRQQAIQGVSQIISEEANVYLAWLQDLPVSQSLAGLRNFIAEILESELHKNEAVADTNAIAKATLDRLVRRPAGVLRASEGQARQELLYSLQTLFRLSA